MKRHLEVESAYYILGLEPGASFAQVKQAYRQLVKIWHPDCFSDLEKKQQAEKKIKTINEAYELLKSYQAESPNPPDFSPADATDATNKTQTSNEETSEHQSEDPTEKKTTKVYVYRSNAQTFYQSGVDRANSGRYEEAIADFTRAIHLSPHYVEAYKYRAFVCNKLGYEYRANADLSQAARIEQNFQYNNQARNPGSSPGSDPSPASGYPWGESVSYRKKSFLERLFMSLKALLKKLFLIKT